MISARGVNSSENQIHSYKFQTFYFISLFQTFWVSLLGRFINLLFSSCFLFFTRNLHLSSSKSSFSSTNILCSTRDLALLKPPEKSSSTFCRRRLFRLSSDLLRAFKVLLSHQDPKFHNVKSFTKIVWKRSKFCDQIIWSLSWNHLKFASICDNNNTEIEYNLNRKYKLSHFVLPHRNLAQSPDQFLDLEFYN